MTVPRNPVPISTWLVPPPRLASVAAVAAISNRPSPPSPKPLVEKKEKKIDTPWRPFILDEDSALGYGKEVLNSERNRPDESYWELGLVV